MNEQEGVNQEWPGKPIEDASEETFLLFSQDIPSSNLGFVDESSTNVEVTIGTRTITLKQSPGVLHSKRSGGTTGAVLWKITPLVAEWLASLPHCLRAAGILHSDAVVAELGCGTAGLIGIVLSPLVSIYLLTDQKYVMKTLRDNIDANTAESQRHPGRKRTRESPKPTFVPLDWETDKAAGLLGHIPKGRSLDLVVVCDCVYNEHLIKPLIETLVEVCELATAEEKPTHVLVAQQLRSYDVFEQFLEAWMVSFQVWRMTDEYLPESLQSGTGYAVHLARLKAEGDRCH